jgi:hypothetical protein
VAITQANQEYNTFVAGLITEANPLTYPPNASLAEENFELNVNGSRNRRFGIDYENNYTLNIHSSLSNDPAEDSVGIIRWDSVDNNPNLNFIGVVFSKNIYFYDADKDTLSASWVATVDINLETPPRGFVIRATSISGKLVLATNREHVIVLSYSNVNGVHTISKAIHGVLVRDMWGIDDGLGIDERPKNLNHPHRYNLHNQGWRGQGAGTDLPDWEEIPCPNGFWEMQWHAQSKDKDYTQATTISGSFPSNADIPALGITQYEDRWIFDIRYIQNNQTVQTGVRAPRGHFVIDLFKRGASRSLVMAWNRFNGFHSKWTLQNNFNGHQEHGVAGLNNRPWDELYPLGEPPAPAGPDGRQGWIINGAIKHLAIQPYDSGPVTPRRSPVSGGGIYQLRRNRLTEPWELPGYADESIGDGIKVVATFAGRVWYGGMSSELREGDIYSPLLGSLVLFSQLVTSSEKIGFCFQAADPTSPQDNVPVDTDGGFIVIPDMGQMIHMEPLGRALIVFANNGIWSISGGEGNFNATSFEVAKLSEIGMENPESVVVTEDSVFYWTESGIFVVSGTDPLALKVTNLTKKTIQDSFRRIPEAGRNNCTGAYDPALKKVRWLYNDGDIDTYNGVDYVRDYNKELTFDLTLGAFSLNTFTAPTPAVPGDPVPVISGIFPSNDFVLQDEDVDLYSTSDGILVGTDQVVFPTKKRLNTDIRTKYLTINRPITPSGFVWGTRYSFAEMKDKTFTDWPTINGGVDAAAFLEMGHQTLGDTQRQKQAPYLITHFERTETGFEDNGSGLEAINPSSCLVQAKWDFSNSSVSGKFGATQQAYRLKRNYLPGSASDPFDYGFNVVTSKTKIRGRGKALRLRFTTEPKKECRLLGWGINYTGSTGV